MLEVLHIRTYLSFDTGEMEYGAKGSNLQGCDLYCNNNNNNNNQLLQLLLLLSLLLTTLHCIVLTTILLQLRLLLLPYSLL